MKFSVILNLIFWGFGVTLGTEYCDRHFNNIFETLKYVTLIVINTQRFYYQLFYYQFYYQFNPVNLNPK